MAYKSQIKIVNAEKRNTLVKVKDGKLPDNQIVFSFSFFNSNSICLKDFNNFYANSSDAFKSVADFFQTIKQISNMNGERFYSMNMQTQFHYNEFDDNKVIDRIESILTNGYKMTQTKVNEFERLYFEFSFGNGKRAIGTKIYNNVFEILFLDCNHMVCLESSRNLKIKMLFNFPSIFGVVEDREFQNEFDNNELINILLEDARNGKYNNINDFIMDYDDLCSLV